MIAIDPVSLKPLSNVVPISDQVTNPLRIISIDIVNT